MRSPPNNPNRFYKIRSPNLAQRPKIQRARIRRSQRCLPQSHPRRRHGLNQRIQSPGFQTKP